MQRPTEIRVEIQYEMHADGRYYIRSTDIPGFHLAGADFDALQRDLDPVVKDLLLHNLGFEVESLRWVPSPDDVKQHFSKPHGGKATYIASIRAAA
jgi:hypothetical protein